MLGPANAWVCSGLGCMEKFLVSVAVLDVQWSEDHSHRHKWKMLCLRCGCWHRRWDKAGTGLVCLPWLILVAVLGCVFGKDPLAGADLLTPLAEGSRDELHLIVISQLLALNLFLLLLWVTALVPPFLIVSLPASGVRRSPVGRMKTSLTEVCYLGSVCYLWAPALLIFTYCSLSNSFADGKVVCVMKAAVWEHNSLSNALIAYTHSCKGTFLFQVFNSSHQAITKKHRKFILLQVTAKRFFFFALTYFMYQ